MAIKTEWATEDFQKVYILWYFMGFNLILWKYGRIGFAFSLHPLSGTRSKTIFFQGTWPQSTIEQGLWNAGKRGSDTQNNIPELCSQNIWEQPLFFMTLPLRPKAHTITSSTSTQAHWEKTNKSWDEETLGNVERIMRKKKGENDQNDQKRETS